MTDKHAYNNWRIVEKYGLTGNTHTYITKKNQDRFLRLDTAETYKKASKWRFFYNFCRKVFLPQGYPKTVSEDYFEYQFYDTIQAFASRITGTIATKSILKSVGVGNAEATPLAAAIIWIFKDGVGMLGGILFAWFKGTEFDANCKRWRLFADILNDVAMFIELFLPFFTDFAPNLSVLCITTCLKSMVGVAGSATRAAVTQHQAVAENAAEVAAKDGSQETAVNLAASLAGILFLTLVEDSKFEITLFVLFTILHLLANYLAVKSLVFKSLNCERFMLNFKSYIRFDSIPNPVAVNRSESIFLWSKHDNTPFGLCGWHIHVGKCFNDIITNMPSSELEKILIIFKENDYFIIPNFKKHILSIHLKNSDNSGVILSAYFQALVFGISYYMYHNLELDFLKKRTTQINLLARLQNKLRSERIEGNVHLLQVVNTFVASEMWRFMNELDKKGWKIHLHAIPVEDWRIQLYEYTD